MDPRKIDMLGAFGALENGKMVVIPEMIGRRAGRPLGWNENWKQFHAWSESLKRASGR